MHTVGRNIQVADLGRVSRHSEVQLKDHFDAIFGGAIKSPEPELDSDTDDGAIFDPALLDVDIMMLPSHQNLHFRKDSFTKSAQN